MLLFIAICLLIGSILTLFLIRDDYKYELVEYIAAIIFAASVLLIIIFSVIILINRADTKAELASMQAKYEALVYKADILDKGLSDEFGLNKIDVVNEIQEWNETLASNKSHQHNLWIGVFYPKIYDRFEYIPYADISLGGSIK